MWRKTMRLLRSFRHLNMLIIPVAILALFYAVRNLESTNFRELDKKHQIDVNYLDHDTKATSELDDDRRRRFETNIEVKGSSDNIESEQQMLKDFYKEIADRETRYQPGHTDYKSQPGKTEKAIQAVTDVIDDGLERHDENYEELRENEYKPFETGEIGGEMVGAHFAGDWKKDGQDEGEDEEGRESDHAVHVHDSDWNDDTDNSDGKQEVVDDDSDPKLPYVNEANNVSEQNRSINTDEVKSVDSKAGQELIASGNDTDKEHVNDPMALDPIVANYEVSRDAEKIDVENPVDASSFVPKTGNDWTLVQSGDQDPPVLVIIMAQWRFGSSIIGELFNQNPAMFYMYEPLWVVEEMVRLWRVPGPFSRETYYYSTKLLQDFSRCDLSDKFMDVINLTNRWGGRHRNNAICKETQGSCFIPSVHWFRDVCSKFKGHLATKIIRGDIGMIKPLVMSDDVNVKVIHLVRDPRGAMSSRIKYLFDVDKNELANPAYAKSGRLKPLNLLTFENRHSDSVEGMCSWLRQNVQFPDQIPDWLRDRYYLLKYEDFADDPTRVTADLYKFAGLHLPESVSEWVVQNTRVATSGNGTFDVAKNSSVTARHWMTYLGEVEIEQVERICFDVMKKLGYQPSYT